MSENLIMFKSKQFTGPDPETPDGSSYSNPYLRPKTSRPGWKYPYKENYLKVKAFYMKPISKYILFPVVFFFTIGKL